jgi:hypothetical protein
VTIPSYGRGEVRVFLGQAGADPIANTPWKSFLAFPSSYVGGGVVAVADMGKRTNGVFSNALDGKAEIIVGSGGATKASVKVFDVTGTPTAVRTISPFSTNAATFNGGVFFSVARINSDSIPDLVIGAGSLGGSKVEVWTWNTANATLNKLGSFAAFADSASKQAPVRVTTLDVTGDGVADKIVVVQGPNGTAGKIRTFNINSLAPFSVTQSLPALAGFPGPQFIASINHPLPSLLPGIGPLLADSLVSSGLQSVARRAIGTREVDAVFAEGVFA